MASAVGGFIAGQRQRQRRRARIRKREFAIPVAVVTVFMIGALTLVYPAAAAWITQYQQSELIARMSDEVRLLPPEGLAEQLEAARVYNASLVGEAVLAANTPVPSALSGTGGGSPYRQLLAANSSGLMARLKIPGVVPRRVV